MEQQECCPTCQVLCASSAKVPCRFCWYDFESTDNDRAVMQESDAFREQSVHVWYKRLGVDRTTLSLLSPITLMHILHDCFRARATTPETTLKLAAGIFPESVAWLKRLIKGTLPLTSSPDNTQQVYKFAAGIDRSPIWYCKKDGWSWSPNWPVTEWLRCPRLIVPYEPWIGQVPQEENIFIILFLHKYRSEPSYADPKLDQNFRRNEHLLTSVYQFTPTMSPNTIITDPKST